MKRRAQNQTWAGWGAIVILAVGSVGGGEAVRAQGTLALPQPDVVLYGTVIKQPVAHADFPASVSWSIVGNNESITAANTTVVTINDDTFYITRIPFETRQVVGGPALPATPNVLELTQADTTYTRSATVDGKAAVLPAGKETFTYGAPSQGLIERIDLVLGEAETYAEWAARLLGDPNADPAEDSDGDGFSNDDEFRAGTNPTDRTSALEGDVVPMPGGAVVLRWPSVVGKVYTLERATDLTSENPWLAVVEDVPGTGDLLEFLDSEADQYERLYYRVRVSSP